MDVNAAHRVEPRRYAMNVTDRDLQAIVQSRWWRGRIRALQTYVVLLPLAALWVTALFTPFIVGIVTLALTSMACLYVGYRIQKDQYQAYINLKKELTEQ